MTLQLWAIIAGAISPLCAYVLNYLAPWVSQTAAQFVQGIAAVVAGALAELINTGDIGFDKKTLTYVLTAVAAALAAHFGYTRGEGDDSINTRLGGGRNVQDGKR